MRKLRQYAKRCRRFARASKDPNAKSIFLEMAAAWLMFAALAHNLLRWTASLGLQIDGSVVTKTIRRRFVAVPGRITRSARRLCLHLPAGWPWRDAFLAAVRRLRALPLLA